MEEKDKCKHNSWGSLGFQKINATESKVEVIAAIYCHNCGMIRTKILYYDRQKDKEEI